MTLENIKREIEEKTQYKFEYGVDLLDREALKLLGLPTGRVIRMYLSNYDKTVGNGAEHISIVGRDQKSWAGFGCPCENVQDAIDILDKYAKEYGWEYVAIQEEMF